MARFRGPTPFVLLLCALLAAVSADDKCRTGCKGASPNLFKFQEGATYKYNLDGSIDVVLSSAENQQTTAKIKAVVLLSQLANCNQVIRLQNVQILGPDGKKHGNLAGVEKAISLNSIDGRLEDVICAEPGDNAASLNIKRAVASMFQAATKQGQDESDIFGTCPTDVVKRKDGQVIIINKRRDLNKCSNRESSRFGFLAAGFNKNSEIKTSPLLGADYDAELRIKDGILQQAQVNENYLYRPFSVGSNGAKAVASTKLTYVSTSKEAVAAKASEPKSIFMDAGETQALKSNVQGVLEALKATKKTMEGHEVGDTSARSFLELVKAVRASTKEDILNVYGQVKAGAGFKDKVGARKVFLDAVFRASTASALEVAMELLKNKELSSGQQELVYMSLPFARQVTPAAVKTAAGVLDMPNLPGRGFLAVGSLIGRLCRAEDCAKADAVKEVQQKLLSKLGDVAKREDSTRNVAILKGLANSKFLTDAAVDKLAAIAKDKKVPNRVRVAALEALTADACKDKVRNVALSILEKLDEDSEVRIKAYLAAAQCPNAKVAKAVKDLVETEKSYQVGGFVESHLKNIRASVNPDKELARQVLGPIHAKKWFPIDLRKFSFNSEVSYTADTLGAASSAESNVIYSQTGFLPRSVSLNLTTDVFGNSFNALELTLRQENLEKVMEHYLGPVGVAKSLKEGQAAANSLAERIQSKIKERLEKTRSRRDVTRAELDAFAKQVKVESGAAARDLELDLSLKLFGSEVAFVTLDATAQGMTPEGIIDQFFDKVDEGVEMIKKFDKMIMGHFMLMDAELSYPTSLGYPLKLTGEVAGALHFTTAGNIDVKQILKDPTNAQLRLSIIPSINVEAVASLKVDAYQIETGLKTLSGVHSSTGTDVTIQLLNGKGVDVKASLPVDKERIVSLSHEIAFSSREPGKLETLTPLKFSKKRREMSVCFDQLSPFIGLTACGDVDLPAEPVQNYLPFPLNGPAKLSMHLEKEDLPEYHFRALLDDKELKHRKFELSFDTPKSQAKRKLSLLMELISEPNPTARATLKSPLKNAIAEAVLTNTEAERSVMARLQYDDMEYLAKLGVSASGNEARRVFKPLLEVRHPGQPANPRGSREPPYTVRGQIVAEKTGDKHKFTFEDVKIVANDQPVAVVTGNVGYQGQEVFADVKVTAKDKFVAIKGQSSFALPNIKLDYDVKNNINAAANFHLKLEHKKEPHQMENSLMLAHGEDQKKNVLSLSHFLKNKYDSKDQFEFATKSKLTYPLIALEGKFEAEANPKLAKYDAELVYGKFKAGSELEAKINTKNKGDYDVEFEIAAMSNKVELKVKRQVEGEKSKISNSLDITGKKYSVDGLVEHQISKEAIKVGADLSVSVHGKPDPIKIVSKLEASPKDAEGSARVTSGSTVYLDATFKGTRTPNPSGNLKVIIKDVVDAKGQLKMTGGKGSGSLLVELLKIKRKIKSEATFNIEAPTYNVDATVLFDFEKDNNKKIHVTTNNKIADNSFDTKNTIEIMEHKLIANVNGKLEGKVDDGKLNGAFDITWPNGYQTVGKLDKEMHKVEDVANGKFTIELEEKTKNLKLTLKGQMKDTNCKTGIMDVLYNLVASCDKKDLKADLMVKRAQQGDKMNADFSAKLYGSMIPKAMETTVNSVYSHQVGSYKANTKYGEDLALSVDGKYSLAAQTSPLSGDITVNLKLPNDKYKSIKVEAAGTVQRPDQAGSPYQSSFTGALSINDAKPFKVESKVKAAKDLGELQLGLELPDAEPMSLAASYKHEEKAGQHKGSSSLDIKYAKDKNIKLVLSLNKLTDDEINMDVAVQTPLDKPKEITLNIKGKKSNAGKNVHSELILTADKQKYTAINDLVLSENDPSVDIRTTYPDGKASRIYAKFMRLSQKQFKGEIKIDSVREFGLEADGEANLESVDDFQIKLNVNSEKLKLDKVKVEVANKEGKQGKKIQFSAKSADKNLMSGSTSYKVKEEAGKYIVEGSGTFKVKDESKQANFKFIRQNFAQEKDGEQGTEMVLTGSLGQANIVGELKLTNKQFRAQSNYCDEKKECAGVDINSKINSLSASEYNHELEVSVDLRKLGIAQDFGLKSTTSRKNLLVDHTVDVHFESQAKNKYQYSFYLHPKEAGVSLTMPKRVMSAEAKLDLPKDNKLGPVKGEVVVHLNKLKEPKKKTVLSGSADLSRDDKGGRANAEVRFSTPGLAKDLVAKYEAKYDIPGKSMEATAELDIFAQPAAKIVGSLKSTVSKVADTGYRTVTEGSLASKGLNFELTYSGDAVLTKDELGNSAVLKARVGAKKTESIFVARASKTQSELMVKVLDELLLKIKSKYDISKEKQTVDTDVQVLNSKPMPVHFEVNNFNSAELTMGCDENPELKIKTSSAAIMGQKVEFRVEMLNGKAKKDLVFATLRLTDADFLKYDFGVKSDNIKTVMDHLTKRANKMTTDAKDVLAKYNDAAGAMAKELNSAVQSSAYDVKPILEYNKEQMRQLGDELMEDKTVKEAVDFLTNVFGGLIQTVQELAAKLAEAAGKLLATVKSNFEKISEVVTKNILPRLKELTSIIIDFEIKLFTKVSEMLSIYMVKVSELFDKYQKDLQAMADTVRDALKEAGQLVMKTAEQIRKELEIFAKSLYDQLKELPVVNEIKQRLEELLSAEGLTERVLPPLRDLVETLKASLPTEESKKFVDIIFTYIEKLLKREKFDDSKALQEISKTFSDAVNSIVKLVRADGITIPQNIDGFFGKMPPLSFEALTKLPRLTMVRFSPVNYILNNDFRTLITTYYINFKNLFPPANLHGLFGRNVFTFDGETLTLPGKCTYLLAKDTLDGNFTLVATYKNEKLQSVTLADKKDVVTIKGEETANLNGAPAELPIRHQGISVFRLYNSIHIWSKESGVYVMCGPQLMVCGVHVPGYYHGRLRGLLGNGNHEVYDDAILPSGKITESSDELINAWKIGASCANVKTTAKTVPAEAESCNALFNAKSSSFWMCLPWVNQQKYKDACNANVEAKVAEAELRAAVSYVAACNSRGIPVKVPSNLLKCTNSDKPVAVGDDFSVKLPQKSADIVIVVQQTKPNEAIFKELVQPVVTQLTTELNAKGLTDLQFALIGYDGEYQKWPSLYTNGGKLAFQGKGATLKFADPPEPDRSANKFLASVLTAKDYLKKELMMGVQGKAVSVALDYPFRSHSVKTILTAMDSCEQTPVPILQQLQVSLIGTLYNGMKTSVIANLNGFEMKDSKQTKNVVGFSKDGVLLLSDAKKKSDKHADLLDGLVYKKNICAEAALASRGHVFVASNFQGKQKKQFVQVVTQALVEDLTGYEQHYDCSCKQHDTYSARNVCKMTSEKPKK